MKYLKIILLISVLIMYAGCDTASPAVESESDALEILSNLGVLEVNDPPALEVKTTLGTVETIEDPDVWHPLIKNVASLFPQSETLILGVNDAGSRYNTLMEDSSQDFSRSQLITDDQAWEEEANNISVSGDFDADGLDEMILFSVINNNTFLSITIVDDGEAVDAGTLASVSYSSASDLRFRPGGGFR